MSSENGASSPPLARSDRHFYCHTCSSQSLPRSAIDWDQLDHKLRRMLAPVNDLLNNDNISTTEAAESFTSTLRKHLIHNSLMKARPKRHHRDHLIIKLPKVWPKQKYSKISYQMIAKEISNCGQNSQRSSKKSTASPTTGSH